MKMDVLGSIHHKLGNEVESVDAYEKLLERNSTNLETYKKIIAAKDIKLPENISTKVTEAYQGVLAGMLREYATAFPKVNSHLRVGLRYLWGKDFAEFLDLYLRPLIIKGVPSVMESLKEFYVIPEKVEQIEAYLNNAIDSMETEMTLTPGDDEEQDPTVILWLYYFKAQHFLFCNRLQEALQFVNKAISHTPTLLELYTLKAKIYQKGGDRQKAATLYEEARGMDGADRAINAISAMHTLKAGRIEEGIKIMDMFVKDCGYDISIHDN